MTLRRPSAIEIEISDTQSHLRLDHQTLSDQARRTLHREGVEHASISIALVDDATIQEINRRHLSHDWPTDVISFVLSEPGEPVLSGELVVSAERAIRVAAEIGLDPIAELTLYLVHGLLHLCGHDDRSAVDVESMRRREAEVLAELSVAYRFPPAA
ncbi:hypothetical protein BH23PLA1_BH23PLA1_33710 [soil metagenome]